MKLNNNIYKEIVRLASTAWMLIGIIMLSGCETDLDKGTYPNNSEPLIGKYLSEREDLSSFWTIIEKADMKGVVDAYGTYTCFAPNNEAVQLYFETNGLSMELLTEEEAAYMVKYHLVSDTLSTADFNESRLDAVNMAKQYISTKTDMDEDGSIIIRVNRDAVIVDKGDDRRFGNGYVHVIDGFLSLPTITVEETVMNMPDEDFSMMKSLLAQIKKAPYKLSISDYINNDTTYLTFLAQTNDAFNEAEIYNLDSLIVRLRANDLQSAYTDTELLKNWLGYHCLQGRVYMKDILEASALNTQVKGQVITVTTIVDAIYLNRFKTENIDEDGIRVLREGDYVDYACKDGVVQTALDELEIIERAAYRVYWDMADQPEMRALKDYRKPGANQLYGEGELSTMKWGGKGSPAVRYYCGGLPEVNGAYDDKAQYVYGDYLVFRICTNVMQWMEITTPVLVAGKYKIWICWRRMNPCMFRTTFMQEGEEDQVLPAVVNLEDFMPVEGDDDQREAQGWKQYNAKKLISVFNCKNIGIIDVKSTGAHTLRFDATIGSKDVGNNWDMIQFIPLDEDQLWPRIAMDGTLVYKGTPSCQIFPENGETCVTEEDE